MRHSNKKIDLTGQRFGKLTVLRPAENIGRKTAWVCRCDCGRETIVKTQHLRSGDTKSCGEGRSEDNPLGLTYVDGAYVEQIAATKTVRKNNTSGVPGVYWKADKQTWRATIFFKGKRYYLGNYHNFEDAVKARKRGEEEIFEPFLREFAGAEALRTAAE